MSRLYGTIDADASKTTASRRAHRNITGHVRGWNVGVEVRAYVNADDQEVFEVYRTGGSNGGRAARLVARIVGDGVIEYPYRSRAAREAQESGYGDKSYWDYLEAEEVAKGLQDRSLAEALRGNDGE